MTTHNFARRGAQRGAGCALVPAQDRSAAAAPDRRRREFCACPPPDAWHAAARCFLGDASERRPRRAQRKERSSAALGAANDFSQVGIHLRVAVNIPVRALFDLPVIQMVRELGPRTDTLARTSPRYHRTAAWGRIPARRSHRPLARRVQNTRIAIDVSAVPQTAAAEPQANCRSPNSSSTGRWCRAWQKIQSHQMAESSVIELDASPGCRRRGRRHRAPGRHEDDDWQSVAMSVRASYSASRCRAKNLPASSCRRSGEGREAEPGRPRRSHRSPQQALQRMRFRCRCTISRPHGPFAARYRCGGRAQEAPPLEAGRDPSPIRTNLPR